LTLDISVSGLPIK